MATRFLQQRLFPTLKIGVSAMVARGNQDVPLHVRQSNWDGACGTYCAAMALALLGRISDVTVLSERRKGVAARLWNAARKHYFDGISAAELVAMIKSLDADLYTAHYSGSHRKCIGYTQMLLNAGRLAIVSWLSRSGHDHHWVLVVGTEGVQEGRAFTPQTFLVLDPGASEPQMAGYNGRLRFASLPSNSSKSHIPYECVGVSALQVRLTAVVAIGEVR
jgi:hypothetical protein